MLCFVDTARLLQQFLTTDNCRVHLVLTLPEAFLLVENQDLEEGENLQTKFSVEFMALLESSDHPVWYL